MNDGLFKKKETANNVEIERPEWSTRALYVATRGKRAKVLLQRMRDGCVRIRRNKPSY